MLLRFAKAAMHMLRRIGGAESKLAETSPMREWSPQQFAQFVEDHLLRDPKVRGPCDVRGMSVSQVLAMVDVVVNYQATFEDDQDAAAAGAGAAGGITRVSALGVDLSSESSDVDVEDLDLPSSEVESDDPASDPAGGTKRPGDEKRKSQGNTQARDVGDAAKDAATESSMTSVWTNFL